MQKDREFIEEVGGQGDVELYADMIEQSQVRAGVKKVGAGVVYSNVTEASEGLAYVLNKVGYTETANDLESFAEELQSEYDNGYSVDTRYKNHPAVTATEVTMKLAVGTLEMALTAPVGGALVKGASKVPSALRVGGQKTKSFLESSPDLLIGVMKDVGSMAKSLKSAGVSPDEASLAIGGAILTGAGRKWLGNKAGKVIAGIADDQKKFLGSMFFKTIEKTVPTAVDDKIKAGVEGYLVEIESDKDVEKR